MGTCLTCLLTLNSRCQQIWLAQADVVEPCPQALNGQCFVPFLGFQLCKDNRCPLSANGIQAHGYSAQPRPIPSSFVSHRSKATGNSALPAAASTWFTGERPSWVVHKYDCYSLSFGLLGQPRDTFHVADLGDLEEKPDSVWKLLFLKNFFWRYLPASSTTACPNLVLPPHPPAVLRLGMLFWRRRLPLWLQFQHKEKDKQFSYAWLLGPLSKDIQRAQVEGMIDAGISHWD